MVAVFPFVDKPTVSPNLGGTQDQLAGAQDNAHRFIIEDERECCHAARPSNQLAITFRN